MITERQEKLLDILIREYIGTATPVGSLALKRFCDLDVCGATIRNDLQALTKEGYITQPHTSAGRIPTPKAYRHFAEKQRQKELDEFIVRQINEAHKEMKEQMQMMEEIMQKLENDNLFEILTILETRIWHKKI